MKMSKYQFEFQNVGDNDSVSRYEATYEGGYAVIEYAYHQKARVLFATGINAPDEADLLAEFLEWVW